MTQGREAHVTLVVVDWIEGDGFDFDEEVVGTWGWRRTLVDFEEPGSFGGEDGGEMLG